MRRRRDSRDCPALARVTPLRFRSADDSRVVARFEPVGDICRCCRCRRPGAGHVLAARDGARPSLRHSRTRIESQLERTRGTCRCPFRRRGCTHGDRTRSATGAATSAETGVATAGRIRADGCRHDGSRSARRPRRGLCGRRRLRLPFGGLEGRTCAPRWRRLGGGGRYRRRACLRRSVHRGRRQDLGRRRSGCGRRLRCDPCWKQSKRIDVAVWVAGAAHTEMNVRHESDCVCALADGADDRALRDVAPAHDRGCPELQQRHHVRVGLDRDHAPATWNSAHEGHGSADRSVDVAADGEADVHPSMLASGVRVGTQRERP